MLPNAFCLPKYYSIGSHKRPTDPGNNTMRTLRCATTVGATFNDGRDFGFSDFIASYVQEGGFG
jgi:hypothetical protein